MLLFESVIVVMVSIKMAFKMRTLSLPKPRSEVDLLVILGQLRRFTLRELREATNNFSKKQIVGRGGSSIVYKGSLADGSVVAVKRFRDGNKERPVEQFRTEVEFVGKAFHRNLLCLRGYCATSKERILVYPFMANRDVASMLRHRQPSQPPIDWPTRIRIALGVCKGLNYLHNNGNFTIIHRDVKAANILLDDDYEAVISDFGLAKIIVPQLLTSPVPVPVPVGEEQEKQEDYDVVEESPNRTAACTCCCCCNQVVSSCCDKVKSSCWNFSTRTNLSASYENGSRSCTEMQVPPKAAGGLRTTTDQQQLQQENQHDHPVNVPPNPRSTLDIDITHVTTAVRGTIGHIAPEYLSTGKCSVKNDVYAYGIMLLELVTGQRAFDLARLANDDDVMLLDWVRGLMKEKELELVVDSDMMGNYDEEEVEQLLKLALLCTQDSPMKRPKMSEVIQMLADGPDGVFLAPKWEEWLREEFWNAPFHMHPSTEWILDSTENLRPEELSGPR